MYKSYSYTKKIFYLTKFWKMNKFKALVLSGFASLFALVWAPYIIGTWTGEIGETIWTTFGDMAVSFLSNFVVILGLAIPLIVIYVVIRMVRGYIGK